jgi:4-amino-4-deoxy-L-arabinose transferase-like glycosyltransferase
LLVALFAAFLGRIVATYHLFNDTADEGTHIIAGLEYIQNGTYTVEAQHPPLGRVVVAALPYLFGGLRLGHYRQLWSHGPWELEDLAFYWRTLSLARAGNLAFAAAVLFFTWRWSSLLYGPWAGVAGCFLAACCPNLIAHAGLATLDIGAAATVLASAYFFWRWAQEPKLRYCVASAIAFALAVLTKFSALLFLPPIAAAYFLIARRKRLTGPDAAIRTALARGLTFCVLVFFVIWAGYQFEVGVLTPPGHQYRSPFGLSPSAVLPNALVNLLGPRRLPAFRLLQGVLEVTTHNESLQRSYLLGRFSLHGWRLYFPVAIAVKTTLPLLLLVILAAALYLVERRERVEPGTIYPIAAIAVILTVSMGAAINIGLRHLLAVYPFFAILGSSGFIAGRRWLTMLAIALGAWHGAESIAAHPDYLAYFNEIARGREERFLVDSNLDWGQDLARLGIYLRENRIDSVYLSYFGVSSPAKMGVNASELGNQKPDHGWIAVSVTEWAENPDLLWLRHHQPAARIGKSIWLYHLPEQTTDRLN